MTRLDIPISISEGRKIGRADSVRPKLDPELIAPADQKTMETEVYEEHSAEPIKNLDTIYRIADFLKSKGRWRDYMLFIVGINFGLRASDLRMLRFSDLITEDLVFKGTFPVWEKKTRNTRKRSANRYISINNAVIEAVTLYLENTPGVKLSDYLFQSLSNNSKTSGQPLTVRSMERILEGIEKDLGLGIRFSTHSLRKTFCYHQMVMSGNDQRKLLLLQKMLGHSSPRQTLDYIGITDEEIERAYKDLNLGSSKGSYLVDSQLVMPQKTEDRKAEIV